MARICVCPAEATIPEIPNAECKFKVGQVQKIAFQRIFEDDGITENSFPLTGEGSVNLLASWTAAIAASDNEKIQISPLVYNPVFTAGEALTTGGGNASPDGIEAILGRSASPMTGEFHNTPQNIIAALKGYECELEVGVFLFVPGNGMLALVDRSTPATVVVKPIPIRSFFVSDLIPGGLEAEDMNTFQMSFNADWSDGVEMVQLDFNPIKSLRNA